jgi:hypothetical protein
MSSCQDRQERQEETVRLINNSLGGAGVLALHLLLAACKAGTGSDQVADQFADAYFRRFDQEAALAYTALGATEMLDKELADTRAIRESGYTPAEAAASVTFTRGPATQRDARVDYRYTVVARVEDGAPVTHEADIELAKIGGGWKVVSVHLVR